MIILTSHTTSLQYDQVKYFDLGKYMRAFKEPWLEQGSKITWKKWGKMQRTENKTKDIAERKEKGMKKRQGKERGA